MEFSESKKCQGILLFLDFEKAFDTLEWGFISKTLEVFNFGNGGFMTNYFEITRGVRQGCPLSPSLFILAVELLALKIRQNRNCEGIYLPTTKKLKFHNLQTIQP